MQKPLAGIMTFADPREEMYESMDWLKDFLRDSHNGLINQLKKKADLIDGKVNYSIKESKENVKRLIKDGMESLILHVSAWTFPSMPLLAANMAKFSGIPSILYGSGGLSGLTATKGALEEVGIKVKVIWGNLKKITDFLNAASVQSKLRGMTLGLFGGLSMGIITGTIDLAQWQKKFGIIIEHIGQVEIIREAEKVSQDSVQSFINWMNDNFKELIYDGKYVTDETLEKQVRCYLATKNLIKRYDLDFAALKCQPELSDHYVNQCLTPTFLNDPFDAEGLKNCMVCSCETDANGALTMQILKILSGGKPTLFMDILLESIRKKLVVCGNCGGSSTWWANRSDDPVINLKSVTYGPHIHGKAGGGAIHYISAPAEKVTWARIARIDGKHVMYIIPSTIPELTEKQINKILNLAPQLKAWPLTFIKVECDLKELIQEYPSQHVHLVEGDYTSDLVETCELLGIEPRIRGP